MRKGKADAHKLSELCTAMLVGEISNRFGLAATRGGEQTASGEPLQADADAAAAKHWARVIVAEFRWLFESDTKLSEAQVPAVAALIRAAFDGDKKAAITLRYLS